MLEAVIISVLVVVIAVMGSLMRKQAILLKELRATLFATDQTLTDALDGKVDIEYSSPGDVRLLPPKPKPWEGFEPAQLEKDTHT